jgi:secretion/DNA translocation related CpaE-like protein
VFVVGSDDAVGAVCEFSVQLSAAVVVLPSGAPRLASAMADATGRRAGSGRVVTVVGGSGGVGASTVAVGLAFVAARQGHRVLLLDADPLGGGLDLLVGAERETGWRWPQLAAARGHLGELSGQLPKTDGVDLLAMARGGQDGAEEPSAEATRAVVESAVRSHELVVVDVGRTLGDVGAEALRRADLGLLVVSADVRGIAAGREMARRLGDMCPTMGLLVRRPRAGGLSPAATADGFHLPLLAAIADDVALAMAAERGEPPTRPLRNALVRACRELLDTVIWRGLVAV